MSLGKIMDPMLGQERIERLGAGESECQLVVSGMSPQQQLALLGSGEPQIGGLGGRWLCGPAAISLGWVLGMLLRREGGAEGWAPGPADSRPGAVRAWEGCAQSEKGWGGGTRARTSALLAF